MPNHTETRLFPYSVSQLYELVADVGRYPEFLPWCTAARIIERGDGFFIAELVIRFKHITESYVSRVNLTPATTPDQPAAINVELVKGPFSRLDNHWRFTPTANGTELFFNLDFHFKTKLLDGLIGGLFNRASEKMVQAFSTRADELYS